MLLYSFSYKLWKVSPIYALKRGIDFNALCIFGYEFL